MMFTTLKHLLTASSLALVLSACGGDKQENKELADARVFKQDSPYSDVLATCARAQQESDYCSLATLPVLGMDFNDPGIAQIMERVVVSHDWMGERFEELLYEMPSSMLSLFKGITAIVIDADIRPAYYTIGTGAIYLDPALLWLNVTEKQTINPKEDYRAGFDDPLAFRHLQRYIKENQPIYRSASLTDSSARELEDITLLAARLLLHELAHANDLLPPDSYDSLDPSYTVPEAANSMSNGWLSSRLTDDAPLLSDTMISLTQVMYAGATPTLDDLEIHAADVGEIFEPDGAGDDYSYTSQFEDLAMLFEMAMMKYYFDADYEIAFTNVPENPRLCSNYKIGWGVRNRVGDPLVKSRAELVAKALLPNESFTTFFENLETPTEISGDWCLSSENIFDQQKAQEPLIDSIDLLRPFL